MVLVGEAHLHRVDSGLGAANALHRGYGGAMQLAQRQQAGIGRVMPSYGSQGCPLAVLGFII